ncbi:MAG: hypothetical protein K0R24_1565, partial [Gammaproteobacteria bacterium]|nr:hypothetical protein [Gammaproteobacteria bacterium]
MKSPEFLAIIAANANKTKNLRSYFGPWPSSINRVPDEIAGKFGRIVSFVQTKINEGYFCNKETEYLLIYNFQPLHLSPNKTIYYSLDLLRKPASRIKHVKEKIGEPMQLVIQGKTGEVMNNSQFMVDVELATVEEIARDKLEPPTLYGNYTMYPAPCCFVVLLSDELLSAELLFKGFYDESSIIQEGKVFENLLDARLMLAESQAVGRYIAEIAEAEEEIPRLKKQGLGLETVKLMDYATNTVMVNIAPRLLCKEEPVEDELSRLEDAFGMVEVLHIKAARIAVAKTLAMRRKDEGALHSEMNTWAPFEEEEKSLPFPRCSLAALTNPIAFRHSKHLVLPFISPVQSSGKVRLPNPATGVAEAETSATESTDD